MANNIKLVENHWYRFSSELGTHIGQYTGNDQGFECCICNKGCKAHTFNIWYNENGWETWGFGRKHLPQIIEDLGEQETILVDQ